MRRTKEEAEETRQQLLQAALTMFSQKGFSDTRLSDIAAEANVTRGAIYWHFGSKKELLLALLRERMNPMLDTIVGIFTENTTPLAKLEKILKTIFDLLEKDEFAKSRQSIDIFELKFEPPIPEIELYLQSEVKSFYIYLTKLIDEGILKNEIRKDVNPEAIIWTILSLIIGFGVLIFKNTWEAYVIQQKKEIVDIILRGIREA